MLQNVPTAQNKMVRQMVLKHPNNLPCKIMRLELLRNSTEYTGGMPTLGGMGVINHEDEDEVDYFFVGNGWGLQAEPFTAAPMNEKIDGSLPADLGFRFLVEPEAPAGTPLFFEIQPRDVLYFDISDGAGAAWLAFEVVEIETRVNIPPYSRVYVTNRRDDMHIFGDISEEDQQLAAAYEKHRAEKYRAMQTEKDGQKK